MTVCIVPGSLAIAAIDFAGVGQIVSAEIVIADVRRASLTRTASAATKIAVNTTFALALVNRSTIKHGTRIFTEKFPLASYGMIIRIEPVATAVVTVVRFAVVSWITGAGPSFAWIKEAFYAGFTASFAASITIF